MSYDALGQLFIAQLSESMKCATCFECAYLLIVLALEEEVELGFRWRLPFPLCAI